MNILINDPEENALEKFIGMIHCSHSSVQIEGIIGIRKFISMDDHPPIQEVVDSGIVPKLLEFMVWQHEPQFQVESSWCILNVCSNEDEFTDYILDLGGLDIILNLFDSNVDDVVSHALWALDNIVLTGPEYRDMCLGKDCVEKLLRVLERFPSSAEILEDATRIFSNLSRGSQSPAWKKILPILPVLYTCISEISSQTTLENALASISCIAEDNAQEIIDQGLLPFLVNHLVEGNTKEILLPIIRALGNVLLGDAGQTDEVLGFPEYLPKIFELTASDEKKLQREAFWTISNIAATSSDHIEMIIQNQELIARLKFAVSQDGTSETKEEEEELLTRKVAKEAAWAILNMITCGTSQQIGYLVEEYSIMESFLDILTKIGELKQEALEAIFTVLETGDFDLGKDYTKNVKEVGLLEVIEDLADDEDFSSNANRILEYFPTLEENE